MTLEVVMQSPESRNVYRAMSPAERLRLTLQAIRDHSPLLLQGERAVVRRRFERLRQVKSESNRCLSQALAEAARHEADR